MEAKERALFLATLSTAGSLVPTAYVALVSNSIVLFGDLLRCVVEFLAILLSWLIVRRISRGDNTFFDFGLGKLEQLAGVAVATAMFCTFVVLALSATHRILSPLPVENAGPGLLLAILSVAGNCIFWWYYRVLLQRSASLVVESQAKLFRAKALASLVVVGTLSLSLAWPGSTLSLVADPIGSVVLGSFLLYSAVGMFSASIRDLLDGAIDEAARLVVIRELVRHEQRYHQFVGIRTRRSGLKVFIEIRLSFNDSVPFGEVADHCSEIGRSLSAALTESDVVILPLRH